MSNETFMKEKPIFPLLMSMALPMVVSMLVNSLYNIVDSFFVARISEDAMTALSLVYPLQNLINAIAIGFGIGITALISYFLGAKEPDKANTAAANGMFFAVIHGVILMVITILILPRFMAAYTSDTAVIAMGVLYGRIAFSFSVIIMIGLVCEKIFQGVGRMKVSMLCLMCGCLTNIVMDPLLIFGVGVFPEMGIAGAGLATGFGQVVNLIMYIIFFKTISIPVKLRRKYLAPGQKEISLRLYAIGIPAALNLALPSVLISALNAILAAYSQSFVVVLGIYYRLQTFLYLPANGFVQGLRPLVGYNFGAGERERVRKLYLLTLGMCALIMAAGTVICLIAAQGLVGLYSTNPETIAIGTKAFRIICAGFIVSAVSVTSTGALEGLGKGIQSLIIAACRYVVIILPIAWMLCRFLGPERVWNAFWITEFITAAIAVLVYRRTVNHADWPLRDEESEKT
ncbi:MAG: MATE family efflux transporter [Lachnospiraceae bacterium]|nr:MATE family efflux transporter [Lachnospiraceae bacterium]